MLNVQNINTFYHIIRKIKQNKTCVVYPALSNLSTLIKNKLLFIYMLLEKDDPLACYVFRNCFCFREDSVTSSYLAPVCVNKTRHNSFSCRLNCLLNACLKKGRKLVLSWKFENPSVGGKVLQKFVNSFCFSAFFKCIRNCNGIEFLPGV